MTKKIKFCLLFILCTFLCQAQFEKFDYKRELLNIEDQWHKIVLPDEFYQKSKNDLTDIRIYGIDNNNETIEVPYIVKKLRVETYQKEYELKLLNQSILNGKYYYSFKNELLKSIDRLSLDLDLTNFDLNVSIEGSQDQKTWFSMVENKRITGIQNEFSKATFTKIGFPEANFAFFRLIIETEKDPKLKRAFFTKKVLKEGRYKSYEVTTHNQSERSDTNQTIIEIQTQLPVMISNLKLNISYEFDYQRPISIYYLDERLSNFQGCNNNCFKILLSKSYVNSKSSNNFSFSGVVARNLEIVIENNANQPLKILDMEVSGYETELHARFMQKAKYYLVYGNEFTSHPSYDIRLFQENIPENLTELMLGPETDMRPQRKKTLEEEQRKKIFESLFLWIVCIVVAGTIGWSTIKMIRAKN